MIRVRLIALLCGSLLAAETEANEPPAWTTEGPVVDGALNLEIPVEVLATKLFLEVSVGGVPRRFVFDTGSPSMLSAEIADELGLATVARTQGRDAHGAVVQTRVVQTDFVVADTTFRKVPVFVAEFPKTARCLFDGVLGSEVLPLCAWQIDLPDGVLRCATELDELDHVEGTARQTLYDFGFPHAPFFDVHLAEQATSKAMFDTGSPEYLAISPPDFEGTRRNDGIAAMNRGFGSSGGSAGGEAPERDQLRVALGDFGIGELELEEVGAVLREAPPSLIGASLLEHFVVTLDQRSAAAWFSPYLESAFLQPSFGFGLSFEGDDVRVSLVWDDSPAATAGLEVGHRVLAIDGESATADCAGIQQALRAISSGTSIELEWEAGKARLESARWLSR